MFSSIDMTQLTPEKKQVFQKLHRIHLNMIRWLVEFYTSFLDIDMRIKIISGLVNPFHHSKVFSSEHFIKSIFTEKYNTKLGGIKYNTKLGGIKYNTKLGGIK